MLETILKLYDSYDVYLPCFHRAVSIDLEKLAVL